MATLPDPRTSLAQLGIANQFTVRPDNTIVYNATGQTVPMDYFLSGQYQNDMTNYGSMRSIGAGNPFAAAPAPAPAHQAGPAFDIYEQVLGNGSPGAPHAGDGLNTIMVGANRTPDTSDGVGGWNYATGSDGTGVPYLPKWAIDMGLNPAANTPLIQGYTNAYTHGNDIYAGNAIGHVGEGSQDGSPDFYYIDPSSWIKVNANSPQFAAAHTGQQSALNGSPYETLDQFGNVTGQKNFEKLFNRDHVSDIVGALAGAGLFAGALLPAALGAGAGAGAAGSAGVTGAEMAAGAGIGSGAPGAAFGGIGAGSAGAGFGLGTLPELGIGGASTFGSAGIGGMAGAGAALGAAGGAGALGTGGFGGGSSLDAIAGTPSGLGAGAPGSSFGGIGTGSAGSGFGVGTLPELGVGGASTFGSAGVGGLSGAGAALSAAAGGSGLLGNLTAKDLLGAGTTALGGLSGAQAGSGAGGGGGGALDPRLESYIYGNGGLMPQTKSLLDAQMPIAQQQAAQMAQVGSGLLSQPISGNGVGKVGADVAQNGYDMLTSRPVTGNQFGQVQMADPMSFMNPFYKGMADDISKRTADLLGANNNAIRGNAVGVGGLGGSRQGLAEGTAAAKAADTLQGQLAGLGGGMFNTALGAATQKYGTDTNFATAQRQQDLSKYFGDADIYAGQRNSDITKAGQDMSFWNTQRQLDQSGAQLGGGLLGASQTQSWAPLTNASSIYKPYSGLSSASGNGTNWSGVAGGLLSGAALAGKLGFWG